MKKLFLFIGGVICAAILLVCGGVTGYLFYSKGEHLIEQATSMFEHRGTERFARVGNDFNLSFESEQDVDLFQANGVSMELSEQFATAGKKSLLVEFPSGTDVVGIMFDIIGKNCLNWSGLKEFSFDIYNSTNASGVLIIRIKSGEKYPKRLFSKEIGIPANGKTTISISHDELAAMVDLSAISHLNIYMHDPSTSFRVYFDNMRVTK